MIKMLLMGKGIFITRFASYLGLVALLLLLSGCNEWARSFDPDGDNPYDLDLLTAVLEQGLSVTLVEEIDEDWLAQAPKLQDYSTHGYLAVSGVVDYTEDEGSNLIDFIAKGGYGMIAAELIPFHLLDTVALDSCLYNRSIFNNVYFEKEAKVFRPETDTFVVDAIGRFEGSGLSTLVFNRIEDCPLNAVDLLGFKIDPDSLRHYQNRINKPIAIRIAIGKGFLDLLSSPIFLTNAYVADSLGQGVISQYLSLIPESVSTIHYDRFRTGNRLVVENENMPYYSSFQGDDPNRKSILKHVLDRPALASAWYMVLAGSVLFLIFGAKRKQRVIPILQPRRNTSHEHLGNVARLYLARPNNNLMARKQLNLFEAYCQRRFGLMPFKREKDLEKLRRIRGIDSESLDSLIRYNNTLARNQGISNNGLVLLVRLLQKFYQDVGRRFD